MRLILRLAALLAMGTVALLLLAAAADARDHASDLDQSGESSTGDAIAGQVGSFVSGGATRVDATNVTRDASARSGDAAGANEVAEIVLGRTEDRPVAAPATAEHELDHEHDDDDEDEEDAFVDTLAVTGSANAGETIGVVTAPGGETDLAAANTSDDVDVLTGDADAFDSGQATTGDGTGGQTIAASSSGRTSIDARNLSHDAALTSGDAFAQFDDSTAMTGDAIGGEVVGAVTNFGATADIVVANASDDVDVDTGDADSVFGGWSETGDGVGGQVASVVSSGIAALDATNLSEIVDIDTGGAVAISDGTSTTGDAIGGQIAGLVAEPGGIADLVSANVSTLVELITGDAFSASSEVAFTGHADFPLGLFAFDPFGVEIAENRRRRPN